MYCQWLRKYFCVEKMQYMNSSTVFATLKCIDQYYGVMQKRCTAKLSLIFKNNENTFNGIISVAILSVGAFKLVSRARISSKSMLDLEYYYKWK